jgi:hypothetical protein
MTASVEAGESVEVSESEPEGILHPQAEPEAA